MIPNVVTVMGGAFGSYSYEKMFAANCIDYIIQGEGEEGFRQLVDYLRGDITDITDVGSLIYIDANHQINKNDIAEFVDVDAIPWVDRSSFDLDMIATYSTRLPNKLVEEKYDVRFGSILTSRGCPYKCGFCSTRLLWGAGIRYRNIADVMKEIEMMKNEHGINTFFFPDDNINTDKKNFAAFLKELKKQNIRWLSGGLQISSMTEEIVSLCIESGMLAFMMAFESGCDETLRKMKKPLRINKAERFVEMTRKIDDKAYIFGAWVTGFPFETLEQVEITHQFAKSLELDWSSFYCYQPYPGSPIYEYCLEKGYVSKATTNITSPVPLLNGLTTENFTGDEIVYSNYCANLDINFLNNRNLRDNPDQAYRDFTDLLKNYPDHVFAHLMLSRYYEGRDSKKAIEYLESARRYGSTSTFYHKYIDHFGFNELLGVDYIPAAGYAEELKERKDASFPLVVMQ